MAEKIKGITIEIGGDCSGLDKALKGVNSSIGSTSRELKQVERLLKLDPKNTELLAQKQELLSKKLETTKNKLTDLKAAQKQLDENMKSGVDVNQQQYRKLQREIVQTEQDLKNLEMQTNKYVQAGKEIGSVGNKMTEIGKKGMAMSAAIVGGAVAATETTREYREDMARLEAAFVTSDKTAQQAKNTYNEFYKILGESDRSVEAVNHLAKLCNSEQELAQWSTICAGVSATFGDSLPIEGLTEAANETAKVGQVTGPLADALNWAGISEDGFNEALKKCNNEKERSALITNTLASTYQNAANEFNTLNSEVIKNREATQKINDAMAELGAILEPIITSIVSKLAELFSWFSGLDEQQQKVLVIIAAIAAAVPIIITVVGSLCTSVGAITKAWGAFNGAAKLAAAGQTLLNAVMSANPITLIIIGITTLVAAFVLLWNKCEGFRNFWIKLWEGIQSAFSAVVDFIKENWRQLALFLVNPIAGAIALLYKLNPKFKEWADNSVKKIKEGFDNMKEIGKFILEGLWNGINDKVEWLKGKVRGVVDKIKSWFTDKDGLDEHSPSKWAKTVGEFLMQGLAEGVTEDMSAEESLKKKIDNIKSFIDKNIESIQNEIKQKQDNFANNLKKGSLYDTQTFVFGNRTETKMTLHDFTKDIQVNLDWGNVLTEFENRLSSVSGNSGMNHELMQLVRDMGINDGTSFIRMAMSSDDESFRTFVTDWQRYQESAEFAAAQTYSKEAEQLQTDFFTEVEKGLNGVTDTFKDSGVSSAAAFGAGFMEKIAQVMAQIRQQLQNSSSLWSANGGFAGVVNTNSPTVTNSNTKNISVNITNNGNSATAYEQRVQTNKMFNQMTLAGVL